MDVSNSRTALERSGVESAKSTLLVCRRSRILRDKACRLVGREGPIKIPTRPIDFGRGMTEEDARFLSYAPFLILALSLHSTLIDVIVDRGTIF